MHKPEGRNLVAALAQLAREYRHFQHEHEREAVDGAARHGLEVKMRRLDQRFERLLSLWVPDEDLHQAWTRYLHEGGLPPDAPRMVRPPEFKGVTESGSLIEVRSSADGKYDLIVDGTIESHDAIPWSLDPDLIEPIQIGEHSCREIFEVPPEAVRALAVFLDTPRAEPPKLWARALFDDGLIDIHFGLTPRGHRRLSKAVSGRPGASEPIVYGLLVADASRARLFVLQSRNGQAVPTVAPLVEVSQTIHPDRRARDSEILSDTRPGTKGEAAPFGPRHGTSDHREARRHAAEQRFAAQIVEEATRIWRAHGARQVVVVASPPMLGVLRPAMSRINHGPKPWSVRELARDLTRLAAPALHDALATTGLLPPRGRLPSLQSSPGIPL